MSDQVFFETKNPAQQETEKAVKPASRWRNKWFAPFRGLLAGTDKIVGPGEYFGERIHPSKDVAETDAERQLRQMSHWVACGGRHLGAFPVDGDQ